MTECDSSVMIQRGRGLDHLTRGRDGDGGRASAARRARPPVAVSRLCMVLVFWLLGTPPPVAWGADLPAAATQVLSARLTAVRADPVELRRFVEQLPKGGELHTHLSGTPTPERLLDLAADCRSSVFYIRLPRGEWAEDDPKAFAFVAPATGEPPPSEEGFTFVTAAELKQRIAKGERDLAEALHGAHSIGAHLVHPLDTFYRANSARRSAVVGHPELQLILMADLVREAHRERLIYVEPQIFPWQIDPARTGEPVSAGRARENIRGLLAAADAANRALPADERVIVRPLLAQSRTSPDLFSTLPLVYQIAGANDEVGRAIAGVDLVGNEYSTNVAWGAQVASPLAVRDFLLGLARLYPQVPLSLHAGESREWDWHVRDSVIAGAERVGHAINLGLHPDLSEGDRALLARRRILVEACLTSNRVLLGVSIADHPFLSYLRGGIPVSLSTDDAGVFETNLNEEIARAVEARPDLTWPDLEATFRASLEHAFVPEPERRALIARWERQVEYLALAIGREQHREAAPDSPPGR